MYASQVSKEIGPNSDRHHARDLPDDSDGLPPQDRKAGRRPAGLPIPNRVLVHADSLREIDLPPPPLAAVLPEPIRKGLAGVSGDGQGELYRAGVFGLFRNLDCTGRLAAWQPTQKNGLGREPHGHHITHALGPRASRDPYQPHAYSQTLGCRVFSEYFTIVHVINGLRFERLSKLPTSLRVSG